MKRFSSINYARITCTKCGAVTVIEPGVLFSGLNCECNTEVSKPEALIKLYENAQGEQYELLGRFKDGDLEIRRSGGELSYRVKQSDFENTYKLCEDLDETDITLSLDALRGKTDKAIKDSYTVDELRVLARAQKIRGSSQMNEDKLVAKLKEKIEN